LALVAIGWAVPAAADEPAAASAWQEGHSARLRLIADGASSFGSDDRRAGIEIVLADGWKTYWRMPGDAGVPPSFDWSKSENVAEVEVLFPAPKRIQEAGGTAVGYTGTVILPVRIKPADAARSVRLALSIEYGVCREICIPVEAAVTLELPVRRLPTVNPRLEAAHARVPRGKSRPGDPELLAARSGDGAWVFETRGADDLLIEAPEGFYVPLPNAGTGHEGRRAFTVSTAAVSDVADLKGKRLRLTLIGPAGASETTWIVP
jgi:DsbC/DsbD-like thiol-disulfide interchange protein